MTLPRANLDVSSCLLDPEAFPRDVPLSWPALFGDDRPVEIEIGSGKGLFLVNAARARPEHGYFGIELSRKYSRLAAERVVKQDLSNIKIWPGDAGAVMGRKVLPGSLRAVHVYFPDPWWKARHKKRRVFNASLVAAILMGLEPAGELHVATDVEEYYGVIRRLVAGEPGLVEIDLPEPRTPEHDLDYLTNFERKYRIQGRSIHRAAYRKP